MFMVFSKEKIVSYLISLSTVAFLFIMSFAITKRNNEIIKTSANVVDSNQTALEQSDSKSNQTTNQMENKVTQTTSQSTTNQTENKVTQTTSQSITDQTENKVKQTTNKSIAN